MKSDKPLMYKEILRDLIMITPSQADAETNIEPIIDLRIVTTDNSNLEFSWNVVGVESTSIAFELEFVDPLQVSPTFDIQHTLEI